MEVSNPKNPNGIAICLNCYKIRFNEKGKPTPISIYDIFDKADFIEIMKDFIKIIDTNKAFTNKKNDRILYLREILRNSKSENVFAGVLMKGHNGTETSIDALVKNEVKNVSKVSKDHFHCLPYFFLLYVNKNKPEELIFIAQSYRQFGFKEVFEEAFRCFVNSFNKEITLYFNTLSIATLFEKYVNDGVINKMRFIKHGLQKGAENVLRGDKLEKNTYTTEMSIKSVQGFWGIKESLKYDDASFIEQVQIDGFEFDEAYADIFIAGRRRTINVTRPTQFCAAFDITQDVYIDPNSNLPNFSDILFQSMDVLNNDLIPYL